ncbi:anti-sigma factor [Micromonosporaceae bacterium Da 78-11]
MTTDIHTLVGAYVLDSVDDLERAAFDRHLRECDSCRDEVGELSDTAARLADGAWSVPPPRLRENVMAEIANIRQISPISPAGPIEMKRNARSSRWLRLTASAAAVVAAVATGTTVYAIQDNRVDKQKKVAEAAQASEARVRAILSSPDLVVREDALTGGGRVTVASSRLHNAGVVVLGANTAPSSSRVYQLWTIRAGTPVSEGALGVGQVASVKIVDGLSEASDVAVTVEPEGGSASPTQPIVGDVKVI